LDTVVRFVEYNLIPSLVVGIVMIAVVLIVIRVAGVKSATTRNGLYGIALIKATITLAGFGVIRPVTGTFWPDYEAHVLPPSQIGPVLLLWVGAILAIRNYLADRALQSAGNDEVEDPGHGST
jgi:hypothetical protein